MKQRRKTFVQNFQSRPANFVLWSDGLDYYVSRRVGNKHDSFMREHFVEFFTREADAWKSAEQRVQQRIETLQEYIKRFKKFRKKLYQSGDR